MPVTSVPYGHGTIGPIGVSDLYVVYDEIVRYKKGEVADIQNVLKGEKRVREHNRSEEIEQTLLTETELSKETERDLETKDTSSLQITAQKVLNEKIGVKAGVEASYKNPMVEVKVNAGFDYERASQQSETMASNVSHEITDKAVSKLQERIKETRTSSVKIIVEEKNSHTVDNAANPIGHVIGIYRWVNEVHRCEVVNLGRRLMFEVVLPEPAAFFLYSEAAQGPEGITVEKPDPPVIIAPIIPTEGDPADFGPILLDSTDAAARLLQPADIDETNYMHWVTKYRVDGVKPPPPETITSSTSLNEVPSSSGNLVPTKELQLPVLEGYTATTVVVNAQACIPHANGYIYYGVAGQSASYTVNNRSAQLFDLNDETTSVPVVISWYHMATIAITIEVTCTRTKETYAKWQLETFASIIKAYNDLKKEYDSALSKAEVVAANAITGRNPGKNRQIERVELKKSALALLTDQQFDDFDAMSGRAPSPMDYPQMDLDEAIAEGKYIQFFEQAFEWENISYVFYSYFWGRKQHWIDNLHLKDVDPLFESFLRAGAARVLIPVRPTYEAAIAHYLATGETWNGGDPPQVNNPMYVSIVDTIREREGAVRTPGVGLLAVTQNNVTVTATGGVVFDADENTNQEIVIKGKVFRIKRVVDPSTIELMEAYPDATEADLTYEFGLKYVGQPWEFTIPTPLVILQEDSKLPDLTKEA